MNDFRTISAALGVIGIIVGAIFSIREEAAFGRTLMIASAIIIFGVLISSAISQKGKS
jgi:hypothetical protein